MPTIDRLISILYRSTAQVALADYRRWALEALGGVIAFDAALWGTGHISTGRFHTRSALNVSPALFDTLVASRHINPIAGYLSVSEDLPADIVTLPRLVRERLGKPVDMADLIPDSEFYSSRLYLDYFHPHGIERILSSVHLDERSGIFTLLTLYRFNRDMPFSEEEKSIQSRVLYHLLSAASHAQFLNLSQDHESSDSACALCDRHGIYHDVEPAFLDMMDTHFGTAARHRLPFAIPGKPVPINGLIVAASAQGELYRLSARPQGHLDRLTEREQEVVRGIGKGLSFKQVARELGVAPSTVSNHLYRVYRKLGINSRSELAKLLEC